MAPRSAVERSEHRNEIDDLLLNGQSPRNVSEYLKTKYNESISHTAINNYKKKHLNVEKEAAIIYNQKVSEKKKNKAVKKAVSDLEKLDQIIDDSLNTQINIERLEKDPTIDQARVEDLKLKKRKQAIEAINVKNNILKNDDKQIDVNITEGFGELADAIKKSREIT
jgi:hypothetical protein